MLTKAGAWRPCTLARQPETEGWWFNWPAGPAVHCCGAAGHMLVVPSDLGRPSGLGCVAAKGSSYPRDHSQQPVERTAWIKSHTSLGPALALLLGVSWSSWKWRHWMFGLALPNSYPLPQQAVRWAEYSRASLAVSFSFCFSWSLAQWPFFLVQAAQWRQVQNPGSLSVFYKHSDH